MTKRRNFLKTIAGIALAPFGSLTARQGSPTCNDAGEV